MTVEIVQRDNNLFLVNGDREQCFSMEDVKSNLHFHQDVASALGCQPKDVLQAYLRFESVSRVQDIERGRFDDEANQQPVDEDLVGKPTPRRVANRLMKADYYATLAGSEEILVYRDGIYVEAKDYIKQRIQLNEEEETPNKYFISETLGHIERTAYYPVEEFDADPTVLNVKNGLISTETFTISEHTPTYLSRVQLPIRFDPNADCPTIKKFLSEVMYEEDLSTAQEYVGSCLWRGYETQKALLLIGEGSNGKSTFINLIKALLGRENISTRGLQELEYNRFAKADLYGKLANLYPDLSSTALTSTGTFKQITGGDPFTVEYKFRNGFSVVNYAKLIFSCNRIPESVNDDSTAFFRRWIILSFPNSFEGTNQNQNLLSQLTTPEELSGFFNWALQGLQRLKTQRWKFTNSKSTEEIREEYIRKSSPIQAFIMDCLTQKSDGTISKQILYENFTAYCLRDKLPTVTRETFFKNLPKHIVVNTAKIEKVPSFIGLALKPVDQWRKDEDTDDLEGTLDSHV